MLAARSHSRRWGLAIVVLFAAPLLSGCFGAPPATPPPIPQFILVPGTGYNATPIPVPSGAGILEFAAISPSGGLFALSYSGGVAELRSSDGSFIRTLTPVTDNATCAGATAVLEFLRDDLLVAGAGACLTLMRLDGTVVAAMNAGVLLNLDEPAFSADGGLVATTDATHLIVGQVGGTLSAGANLPVVQGAVATPAHLSLSPDGTRLSATFDTTRFYAVDVAGGTLTLLGEFPRVGRVLFTADSRHAVQSRDDDNGTPSDSIAFYDLTGAQVASGNSYACAPPPPAARPACPAFGGLATISATGRYLGWSEALDVRFVDQKGHGNWTRAAAVHVLDPSAADPRRGFEAGEPTLGAALAADGPQPPVVSVVAIRVLSDGSAFAVSASGTPPQSIFFTRALANATVPTAVGNFL